MRNDVIAWIAGAAAGTIIGGIVSYLILEWWFNRYDDSLAYVLAETGHDPHAVEIAEFARAISRWEHS